MLNFPGYIRKEAAGFWIEENFYAGFGYGYLDDNFQSMDNLNDLYEYNSLS
jgi:N-acetylneuraminic acid mutarotase